MNFSKGVCVIRLNTTAQDFSMADLITELNTNSSPFVEGDDIMTYGRKQLITVCSLVLNVPSPYEFYFASGQQISSWGGIYFGNTYINTNLDAVQYVNIQTMRRGGYGNSFWVNYGNMNYFNIGALYDEYIINGTSYGEYAGAGINNPNGLVTGYGSIVASEWITAWFKMTEFSFSSNLLGLTTSNSVIESQNINAYAQVSGKNVTVKDSVITKSFHFRFINNNNNADSSLDTTFIDSTTREELKYPIVYVIQYTTGTHPNSNESLVIGSTFNLIVNSNMSNINESVEDAIVIIRDNDGDLVYNGTTDENGSISTSIWWGAVVAIDETPTGINDLNNYKVDNNPYNITITKDKYETYEGIFEIYKKGEWTITLESRDWNYSNTLAWKILNLTDTTILKLDENGNLAIAGKLYENTNTAPNNVLYKIKDLFWLTKTGDLYLVKELMELIL